jgi:hypothetical protein
MIRTSTSAIESARAAAPTHALARSRSRKRRFLVVAVAALASVGVLMGVSFLDQSGSTTLSVQAASGSNLVWPASGSSFKLPVGNGTKPLNTTEYASGPATVVGSGTCDSAAGSPACDSSNKATTSTLTSGQLPSWSPTASAAGNVTQAGDVAVIDATQATGNVIVSLYITNLAALSDDYSSFAFPIDVFKSAGSSNPTVASTWTQDSSIVPTGTSFSSFLTDTSGVITFALPAGYYYDLTMDSATQSTTGGGGSYYCISTTASGGDLSPAFFVTANPTA